MIADTLPDRPEGQLLRSVIAPVLKQGGDAHQDGPGSFEIRMQTGESDRGLSGMHGPAADRGHQPGTTGDRFVPHIGVGRTNEQTPASLKGDNVKWSMDSFVDVLR